jgi:uncharacterized DUF497 family protein
VKFEWDRNKAAMNRSKHGVTFEEAETVFDDILYLDYFDPDHSHDEYRYIIIGQSSNDRLLVVSYSENLERVRLISARKATKKERKNYEKGK